MTKAKIVVIFVLIRTGCSNLRTVLQLCEQSWLPTRCLMLELLTAGTRVPTEELVNEGVLA